MIIYYLIATLVMASSSIFLSIFVLLKNFEGSLNRLFSIWTICGAIWGWGLFKFISSTDSSIALFWGRFAHFGAIGIPILFLNITIILLGNVKENEKKILGTTYFIGLILVVVNFTKFFIKSMSPKLQGRFYCDAGVLYIYYFLFFALCATYAFYLMLSKYKYLTTIKKHQVKYFLIATLIGFAGGLTTFFLVFDIPIPPVGLGFVPVYAILTAYAIVRYRLMDIRVVFTRAGIFLVVYTFVLGVPFVVLQRTGSGLWATSLAVVVASAGPIIYRFLQGRAESVILAQQRSYQKILLRAATGMVTEHNLSRLSKLIVYILKNTIKLNFAAVYILDKESKSYRLKSIRGHYDIIENLENFSAEHQFIVYLKENREPFILEEAPASIKGASNIILKSRVVIPASVGDELLGFVLLGEKMGSGLYTNEDIGVFKILSRQAALAIENCVFFKESQESQEMMFAAEKLASIGGMADGVAHQIKNRLNQFSMASGELKDEIDDFSAKYPKLIKDNPDLEKTFDYLKKISRLFIENVKRTDSIIKGILDFAKVEKKEIFFSVFSLKEATDLSYNLLLIKHESEQLPIKIDLGSNDAIYGIKSQIIEVIYNMLDNAYEATKEKQALLEVENPGVYVPMVELKLKHTIDCSIIEVTDNGIGIKDEDKHKIFAPFFTTKSSYKSGSGIGAYVAKRIIVENHQGKLHFNSTYLTGTSFFIELPREIER